MTPVHIVGGFLGTGKTTVLLSELARREGRERCAILVNDFGEAQIDATLLGGQLAVTNIPGGCVCCTAPEGLVPAIAAILAELKPDRIFVEPSGLGRPRDIHDMLARGAVAGQIELGPTLVLLDPTRAPEDPTLYGEQLEAADVLVANRCDLADVDQIAAFDRLAATMWPAPLRVLKTSFGKLPLDAWDWPEGAGPRASGQAAHAHEHGGHDHGGHDHAHEAELKAPSTAGFAARSWVFPPTVVFSWDALRNLVAGAAGVVRFKGVFRSDLGWYRLDLAGGVVHPAATGYRRDSRVDLIVREGTDLAAFDAALQAARIADRHVNMLDTTILMMVDETGLGIPLSRGALRAFPGQVPDVSAVIPGRQGSGVRLAELFMLLPNAQRYVVTAADGMTTAPAAVADIGDAVLVHTLDDGELPENQGGPFRLLAPAGSSCANVKGVVRIRGLGGE